MQLVARTAKEVKEFVAESSKYFGPGVKEPHIGAMVHWLNKYLGGDANRKLVFGWLFNKGEPVSVNSLTPQQHYGLFCWIDSVKDETTGEWQPQPCFPAEAALVLTDAMKWYEGLKKSERTLWDLGYDTGMVSNVVANSGAVITSITDEKGNFTGDNSVKFPIPDVSDGGLGDRQPGAVIEEKPASPTPKAQPIDRFAKVRNLL